MALPGGMKLEPYGFGVVDEGPDPRLDVDVDRPRPVGATLRIEAHDVLEADADPNEVGRQLVEIDEGAVPGDEAEVAVEHGDALAGVVDRVLEEVAAVLDRRRGVVEELQRRLRRDRPPAQEQRQREPRRGGTDRRGEEMLRIAQKMDVRLGAAFENIAAAMREALEGAVRALLAEIARDGRAQFVDGDAGAEEAEARRDREVRLADEDIGLQPLQGGRRPQEREADVGRDVERRGSRRRRG